MSQAIATIRELPEWVVARAAREIVSRDRKWAHAVQATLNRGDYLSDRACLGEDARVVIGAAGVDLYARVHKDGFNPTASHIPEAKFTIADKALVALAGAAASIVETPSLLVITKVR